MANVAVYLYRYYIVRNMKPNTVPLSAPGQYFASIMIIVGMSVMATVVVLQYHHHDPNGANMPKWVSLHHHLECIISTKIMLSSGLSPVNGWSPYFRYNALLLLISISLHYSYRITLCHFHFIHPSALPALLCQDPLHFSSYDFLGYDSCGSVSLPERAQQRPRRRLQQECDSKRSGYVGGLI